MFLLHLQTPAYNEYMTKINRQRVGQAQKCRKESKSRLHQVTRKDTHRQKDTPVTRIHKAVLPQVSRCISGFHFLCTEVARTISVFLESSQYYPLEAMIVEDELSCNTMAIKTKGTRHDQPLRLSVTLHWPNQGSVRWEECSN